MRRHVLGSLSVVFVFLFVYSTAAAWLPSGFHGPEPGSAAGAQNEGGLPRITTLDEASREIRALEARSKGRHDHLLEDTKALAEASDGLLLLPIRQQASGFRPCSLVFPDFPKALPRM